MPETESIRKPNPIDGGGRFSSVASRSSEVKLRFRDREEVRTFGDRDHRQRRNRRPEQAAGRMRTTLPLSGYYPSLSWKIIPMQIPIIQHISEYVNINDISVFVCPIPCANKGIVKT